MKILKIARKKLAEKAVSWEEVYTPDTAYFKEMYDEVVGKGSYFRFEGKDPETGDWHMVIVGPAKMKDPEAKFFSGQRKLPSTYSASGEYFSDLKGALNHASNNWGVQIPSDANLGLTEANLKGLGDKLEKWREDNSKEDVVAKFRKTITDPKNDPRSASSDGFQKTAMGAVPFYRRQPSRYFDIDSLDHGYPPDWEQIVASWPDVVAELEYARGFRNDLRKKLMDLYGDQGAQQDMHKVWLAINPQLDPHGEPYGSHLLSVGPYLGTKFKYAANKFGSFTQKLTVTHPDEMAQTIAEQINRYNEMYGVQLHPQDFDTPQAIADRYLEHLVRVNSNAKDAISARLADELNISQGSRGWKDRVSVAIETRQREWLQAQSPQINVQSADRKTINDHIKQAWEAYEQAKKSGRNIPKPPMLDIRVFNNDRRAKGSLRPSSIIKFPAFKVVGTIQNGSRTVIVEPSISGHSLKTIGSGSVIKLTTYDSVGNWVYGKREFVVESFTPSQGQQATITLREPMTVDINLPANPTNEWFRNYLINVERRVDNIEGHQIDWSLKDSQIAQRTGIDPARIRELRGAYDAIFYGFDDMQTALDISEISNKGRPKGLEQLKVQRNYSSNDLDTFANLRSQQVMDAAPEEKREKEPAVQGVQGVGGVGAVPSEPTPADKQEVTDTPQGQKGIDIKPEKKQTSKPEKSILDVEEQPKPKDIHELIRERRRQKREGKTLADIISLANELKEHGDSKGSKSIIDIIRKHI